MLSDPEVVAVFREQNALVDLAVNHACYKKAWNTNLLALKRREKKEEEKKAPRLEGTRWWVAELLAELYAMADDKWEWTQVVYSARLSGHDLRAVLKRVGLPHVPLPPAASWAVNRQFEMNEFRKEL